MHAASNSLNRNRDTINKTNEFSLGFSSSVEKNDENVLQTTTSIETDKTAPIKIDAFRFNNTWISLEPPLEFIARFNHEVSLWEVDGEDLYASVLVSANTILEMHEELREEMLPYLWRVYALDDDINLSREARNLKNDLLRRSGKEI